MSEREEMQGKRGIPKPIRLGLIGCGRIVQIAHVPSILALPEAAQVVALADPLAENRERVGRALAVPPSQWHADGRELLEKADVDAVSIATPHHLHAQQVIGAAQAGVAVICEKPFAMSLEEGEAIRAAVQRSGAVYTLVHNLLFSLPMQEALSQIQAGEVGAPFFGRGGRFFNKATSGELPMSEWRNRRETGGGCLADTAYHEIYSVEALIGSPIRYVEARVKTLYFDVDVDDIALMLFEHENGALSTVSASWCNPGIQRGRWCEVHGTRGSIRVNHLEKDTLLRFNAATDHWERLTAPGELKVDVGELPGHVGYFSAVFEALAKGADMPVTLQEAYHTLAIVEAARLASRERRAVEVVQLEKVNEHETLH